MGFKHMWVNMSGFNQIFIIRFERVEGVFICIVGKRVGEGLV